MEAQGRVKAVVGKTSPKSTEGVKLRKAGHLTTDQAGKTSGQVGLAAVTGRGKKTR